MKRTIALLSAALMLLSFSACRPDESGDSITTTESAELEKQAAPDFTVYDQNGNAVKLSDMKGTPVVLNFWASWCYPCKNEMPEFDEVAKDFEGKVAFMMVNLTDGIQETEEEAKAFIKSMDYDFPVYFDKDCDASTVYAIESIPTTYFIDSEGNIIAYAVGSIEKDDLTRGISMIYTEINDK